MENNIEIFKTRLRDEIKQNRTTVKAIAESIGVSPEMVTQYYTTDKLPSLETFVKLCKALDVSADYILGLDELK